MPGCFFGLFFFFIFFVESFVCESFVCEPADCEPASSEGVDCAREAVDPATDSARAAMREGIGFEDTRAAP